MCKNNIGNYVTRRFGRRRSIQMRSCRIVILFPLIIIFPALIITGGQPTWAKTDLNFRTESWESARARLKTRRFIFETSLRTRHDKCAGGDENAAATAHILFHVIAAAVVADSRALLRGLWKDSAHAATWCIRRAPGVFARTHGDRKSPGTVISRPLWYKSWSLGTHAGTPR